MNKMCRKLELDIFYNHPYNEIMCLAVTVVSGLASYPIDTVRRRMMMTSGTGVFYKSSLDCGVQVIKNEGFMSLMKGAGANVLRGEFFKL